MESRRSAIMKLVLGATGLLAGRWLGRAASEAAPSTTTLMPPVTAPASPTLQSGPWELIAPYRAGAPLALGWRVADLSAVERGAVTLRLRHDGGAEAGVALCRNGGQPRGVAHTEQLDLILINGGHGDSPTDEDLGRVLVSLAELLRGRDLDGLMTHAERLRQLPPAGARLLT
jgi:hypothetical protein